jgi:ribosomal-protein-alanine N-acetyltransferase
MAAIHAEAFPPGEAWSAEIFAAQLGLPGVFGLIDERGGMILLRVAVDEAEILTLAVAPAARRQGMGRAILRAATAACGTRGAARLVLEVSAANHAARTLYETSGFTRVGLRRRYYADGADALIMALDLRAPATQPA